MIGPLVCAVAPNMPIVLAGRAVRGAGGGLLAGLGYAPIRSALPSQLWTRASALISAMWVVGTFVGPAVGGAFAQFGSWRAAFVTLALAMTGLAVNLGEPDTVASAHYLFLGFAGLTALGVVPTVAGLRRRPSAAPNGAPGAASRPLPECGFHNV